MVVAFAFGTSVTAEAQRKDWERFYDEADALFNQSRYEEAYAMAKHAGLVAEKAPDVAKCWSSLATMYRAPTPL